MGKRIDNLKRLAARRGWRRVALVLTLGWLVLAWVGIGKALYSVGAWMQDVAGA